MVVVVLILTKEILLSIRTIYGSPQQSEEGGKEGMRTRIVLDRGVCVEVNCRPGGSWQVSGRGRTLSEGTEGISTETLFIFFRWSGALEVFVSTRNDVGGDFTVFWWSESVPDRSVE